MIISASRRSDIPAYYTRWFMERIREGEVLVKNPYNPERSKRVSLKPEELDGIVFWTKNPGPMLGSLEELDHRGFPFYFLFTITGYGKMIEPGIPSTEGQLELFQILSERWGKNSVVWRYDPILISPQFSEAYHLEQFGRLAERLEKYTGLCILSFVEPYRKCRKNLEKISFQLPVDPFRRDLLRKMALLAGEGLKLQTCSQDPVVQSGLVNAGPCVDALRMGRISGKQLEYRQDKNQRTNCLCSQSQDIGEYSTCHAGCIYCYAS